MVFEAAPIRVLVRVSSRIGTKKNWIRAGVIAQIVVCGPGAGAATKFVRRLYLNATLLQLEGAGYPFYIEFWAYKWLSDYHLEVWAQQAL